MFSKKNSNNGLVKIIAVTVIFLIILFVILSISMEDNIYKAVMIGAVLLLTFTGYIYAIIYILSPTASSHNIESKTVKTTDENESAVKTDMSSNQYDSLTGLLDFNNIDLSKNRFLAEDIPSATVLINIDGFSRINELYGYDKGNKLLQKLSGIIKQNLRSYDYVFRYGGDEFLIIMTNITRNESDVIKRKIAIINSTLLNPIDDLPKASCSAGISFTDTPYSQEGLNRAKQAMKLIKKSEHGGYCIYDETERELMSLETLSSSHRQSVLIVDDSELNRDILSSILEDKYDTYEATNGLEAIEYLRKAEYDFALVLLDLTMPELDGFGLLDYMKDHRWNEILPVIIISSENDPKFINRAYDLGAIDYISRPFDAQIVLRRVDNAINLYTKNKLLSTMVSDKVQEQISNYDMMLSILSHVVEFRNNESGPHILHINVITELLLNQLKKKNTSYNLNQTEIHRICMASSLHDIGKITIPDEILNKPGRLSAEEFEIMKGHALDGAKILENLEGFKDDPLIIMGKEIARWHHERYDGNGYPDGLKGEDIPIAAQVVSLADVYDALTSERCYKKAYSHETAIRMIMDGECGAFNPLLLESLNDISNILKSRLSKDAHKLSEERQTTHLMEELHEISNSSISNKIILKYWFEKNRSDFLAEKKARYTFDYRVTSSVLSLSPPLAELFGVSESIIDPLNDDTLLKLSDMSFKKWAKELESCDYMNPDKDITINMHTKKGDIKCTCHVRAVWSNETDNRYLGVTGIIDL